MHRLTPRASLNAYCDLVHSSDLASIRHSAPPYADPRRDHVRACRAKRPPGHILLRYPHCRHSAVVLSDGQVHPSRHAQLNKVARASGRGRQGGGRQGV